MIKQRMQKTAVFFVHNEKYHRQLRFLLFTAPIFILSAACLFDAQVLYKTSIAAIAPCLICGMFLSSVVVISNNGLACYQVFRKKALLRWSNIRYTGTAIRSSWGTLSVFVYFSTDKFSSPPLGRMPPISGDMIYLTQSSNLCDILAYHLSPCKKISHPRSKSDISTAKKNEAIPKSTVLSLAIMLILYRSYLHSGIHIFQILSFFAAGYAAMRIMVAVFAKFIQS